jgi:hypothetical protein
MAILIVPVADEVESPLDDPLDDPLLEQPAAAMQMAMSTGSDLMIGRRLSRRVDSEAPARTPTLNLQ